MEVISLTEEAFQHILHKMMEQMKAMFPQKEDRWIDGTEAMRLLRISSTTTLQKLRDEGRVRYSQPMHKVILYDRESIISYIEKHAYNTFN